MLIKRPNPIAFRLVSFKAPSWLVAQFDEISKRQHVTRAESLRRLIREHVEAAGSVREQDRGTRDASAAHD